MQGLRRDPLRWLGAVAVTGKPGRRPAIPEWALTSITQRHEAGDGYRLLSRWLATLGINASPATCRRAALCLPPYNESKPDR